VFAVTSPSLSITGGCLCGGVRFEIASPFVSANYCHCTRCQRRTGTAASANGRAARDTFRLLAGADLLRTFAPPDGAPKVFCSACGSALFSGTLEDPTGYLGVRLGTLDADPGIRPQWRQHTSSAVSWEAIPDDGLPRHPGSPPR
jgi:hypothetical protein